MTSRPTTGKRARSGWLVRGRARGSPDYGGALRGWSGRPHLRSTLRSDFRFFQRLHLPIALVEARLVKHKSSPTDRPRIAREKETMLAELREVRERTLAFLDETKGRNLAQYRWRHPFLGSFDMYEWFEMVAAHQLRHEKQMRKIAAAYRKP